MISVTRLSTRWRFGRACGGCLSQKHARRLAPVADALVARPDRPQPARPPARLASVAPFRRRQRGEVVRGMAAGEGRGLILALPNRRNCQNRQNSNLIASVEGSAHLIFKLCSSPRPVALAPMEFQFRRLWPFWHSWQCQRLAHRDSRTDRHEPAARVRGRGAGGGLRVDRVEPQVERKRQVRSGEPPAPPP